MTSGVGGKQAASPLETIAASVGLPLDEYRERRLKQAVVYDQSFGNWNVFRYVDAARILNEPTVFSSEGKGSYAMALPSIVGIDGGRHRKLRGLVVQAFTPRMVDQLVPRIRTIAEELLQSAQARESFDVIQDFAYPLPIRIIAELLGIPLQDQATFRRWSETLVAGPRTDARRGRSFAEERTRTLVELNDYLAGQLEARRRTPGGDLISRLLAAEVDGERLTETELLEFCRLLLIAGYETTACQIGIGALALAEMPDVAAELRADPALVPSAVEELVRCFPSVAATVRVALADVELGGQKIGNGQSLIVWAGSANYDDAVFAEPERFDIRRSPNRHLGFGLGPHFCLGAPLARLEVRLALEVLLGHLARIERAEGILEPMESPFLLGVKNLILKV